MFARCLCHRADRLSEEMSWADVPAATGRQPERFGVGSQGVPPTMFPAD